MSSGSLVFSASSSPCGIENGLCEKSTWFVLLVQLEHREVDDPAEVEPVLVDQAEVGPDLGARQAGELVEGRSDRRRRRRPRRPASGPAGAHDRLGPLGAEVLGDRAAPAAPRPRARRCSPGPAGPRPAPSCSCGRRRRASRRPAPGWPRPRSSASLQDAGEQAEAAAAEVLGHVLHLDRVAQVRLVGAVLGDRLAVGDARERDRASPACRRRTPRTRRACTGSMAANTSSWVTKLISTSSW